MQKGKEYCRDISAQKIFLLLLWEIPSEEQEESDKLVLNSAKKQVPKLCERRWSARVSTLSSVIAKYKVIYFALNDIGLESLATDVRTNALSHLNLLESSGFIVSLVVAKLFSPALLVTQTH